MLILISAGFALSATMLIMMQRINMLRFLGYAGLVDVAFTALMFVMFAHTFSGIVAGSFAGLFMATGLTVFRGMLGYERVRRTGWRFRWVRAEPKWHMPKFKPVNQPQAA